MPPCTTRRSRHTVTQHCIIVLCCATHDNYCALRLNTHQPVLLQYQVQQRGRCVVVVYLQVHMRIGQAPGPHNRCECTAPPSPHSASTAIGKGITYVCVYSWNDVGRLAGRDDPNRMSPVCCTSSVSSVGPSSGSTVGTGIPIRRNLWTNTMPPKATHVSVHSLQTALPEANSRVCRDRCAGMEREPVEVSAHNGSCVRVELTSRSSSAPPHVLNICAWDVTHLHLQHLAVRTCAYFFDCTAVARHVRGTRRTTASHACQPTNRAKTFGQRCQWRWRSTWTKLTAPGRQGAADRCKQAAPSPRPPHAKRTLLSITTFDSKHRSCLPAHHNRQREHTVTPTQALVSHQLHAHLQDHRHARFFGAAPIAALLRSPLGRRHT